MRKYFICLAASRKLGGKCVAGVEIIRVNGRYEHIKNEGEPPQWIRPISRGMHGEISEEAAAGIKLMSIYRIDNTDHSPNLHQTENHYFSPEVFTKKGFLKPTLKALERCCDHSEKITLFGNKGAAIHSDVIGSLKSSIRMIKATNPRIELKSREGKSDQVKMRFSYEESEFCFPITDEEFVETYNENNDILTTSEHCFLSISVGVEFNGWYHKLIAGVILL